VRGARREEKGERREERGESLSAKSSFCLFETGRKQLTKMISLIILSE